MAKLKGEQVAAAALLGGFSTQEIPTAVAVAYGESGWNTDSRNSCCSGLWQIHRTAHADKIRALGGESKLTDPVTNAKLAKQVQGGDWCGGRAPNGHCQKFEAYGLSNGGKSWAEKMRMGTEAYGILQQKMAAGVTAETVLGSSGGGGGLAGAIPGAGAVADSAGAISSAAKALVDMINRVGRWVSDPQSWVRVAEVIGGGVLVAVGLRIAFNTQINAGIKGVVGAVVPGGKAGAVSASRSAIKSTRRPTT